MRITFPRKANGFYVLLPISLSKCDGCPCWTKLITVSRGMHEVVGRNEQVVIPRIGEAGAFIQRRRCIPIALSRWSGALGPMLQKEAFGREFAAKHHAHLRNRHRNLCSWRLSGRGAHVPALRLAVGRLKPPRLRIGAKSVNCCCHASPAEALARPVPAPCAPLPATEIRDGVGKIAFKM